MKQNLISLHGGYITENFGDELLMAIHAKWIKECVDDNVALPYSSKEYHEQILTSEYIGIEALKQSKLLIYGGGGYLGEPNHDYIRWGISFFKRKHFLPAEFFKFKKKPYAIIGAGAGPISNVATRLEIVRMCKNAKLVAVRDQESKNYLIKYGVPNEKISVTADVVLTLKNEDLPASSLIEAKEILGDANGKKVLGIHLGVSENDENYSSNMKSLIKGCINYLNNNPNIFPVLIADKRYSSAQNSIIEKLSENLQNPFTTYVHSDIWLTCGVLSMLDGVITTKLHVGITSYTLGTKAMGIAAHQKTERFYKQINQSKHFLRLDQVKDENIIERIDKFVKNIDSTPSDSDVKLKQFMHEQALENKKLTKMFIEKYLIK